LLPHIVAKLCTRFSLSLTKTTPLAPKANDCESARSDPHARKFAPCGSFESDIAISFAEEVEVNLRQGAGIEDEMSEYVSGEIRADTNRFDASC
jgi:hypothetical protein